MKMNVLAPDLILLSFALYEQSLDIMIGKISKRLNDEGLNPDKILKDRRQGRKAGRPWIYLVY